MYLPGYKKCLLGPPFTVNIVSLQLAGVDVVAALDMFVDRGEWEKCLQTAEQQVGFISCANHNTLSKYV